ncbi:Uma2 family endonuclease [Limnofasciculus baicalensis]|uniref:Uma2 family endonuclease n=1 Tax=Limnofasciculus baicalensis BBK-W-15 TaxID=2699891 RepID=A0AAE3KPT0_9CYAN|nr:Uma2 family endonuclease [Limnofasciculus baicalensis]MCP2729988.1 Uma2 family endonuclease [Limnofasciculus baicalensis BBK-W-15]
MIQAVVKTITFEEFLAWYPDGKGRYELYEGIIIEMNPTGEHEEVAAFMNRKLNVEIDRLNLPYFIPRTYLVKPENANSGYQPDVLVLDKEELPNEPLWKKSSTILHGKSVKLAVEVVSTNWRDDYLTKVRDYEEIGIPEYWIVDYLGLGGRRYIGSPKQPTLSIYQLVEGEYQVTQFREDEPIYSLVFPELNLTAGQIFRAGE